MKSFITLFLLFIGSFCGAIAQAVPSPIWTYNWPAATTTGVVGKYLITTMPAFGGAPSASYSIEVYVTGTVPSTCTFEVQSSPDGVVWNTGTASVSGDQSCASGTDLLYSFYSKPVRYLRINIGTLTGADGTTQVKFFYTRGRDSDSAQ